MVPAALADALRIDLDLNLWEMGQVDAGWYREMVGLRDAFREGQRMAQETAATIARETGRR
jgi:hypothetical protein